MDLALKTKHVFISGLGDSILTAAQRCDLDHPFLVILVLAPWLPQPIHL
jgi:hypothetical protein